MQVTINDINSEVINKLITRDREQKMLMVQADEYMNVRNVSISNRRKMMMLYDDNENSYLREDLSKANNKARHSYLQELINQCTNYTSGRPLKIDYKRDITEDSVELIDKELYVNNNFLSFIQRCVRNVQLYGVAYMRVVVVNGKNKFIAYDPKEIIMLYDDYDEPQLCLRYYEDVDLMGKGTDICEVYDFENKYTFKRDKKGWKMEDQQPLYARVTMYGDVAKQETMVLENFPIIEWRFNEDMVPTLANIKDFIDLQDMNLSDLANNVEDIQDAIWILENYNGQNLAEFMHDLKVKKAIKVGQGGDVRNETIQIPIDARTKLYELCEKNIYKFGFGINFSDRDSLGNVTGVALKWSYAPLEQKANAIENNGQNALNQLFNILFRLLGLEYDSNDLEFKFDRTMIANDKEQTEMVMTAYKVLSRKTVLGNLPMVQDVEQELENIEEEDNEQLPSGNITPREETETTIEEPNDEVVELFVE